MARKICVYAICKNEMSNVKKWIKSMMEADYIVVLDTGSTDGTYEYLKTCGYINRVEQMTFDPFRFDHARQTSLSLAPDDSDIFVTTDLDEVFEPGWADILRENWKDDTCRAMYTYIWSHKADGSPDYSFTYDKIHGKGYHWKAPVHEYLMRNDDLNENCSYDHAHSISLVGKVILHHYQDVSKPRASYLDLLKLRVKDNPDDAYGWWYLAREYIDHAYVADGINAYEKAIQVFESNPDKTDIFGMWVASYYNLAKYYHQIGDLRNAAAYYLKANLVGPGFKEPYMKLAEIMYETGRYNMAIGMINEGRTQVPNRTGHWMEEDKYWNGGDIELLEKVRSKIEIKEA